MRKNSPNSDFSLQPNNQSFEDIVITLVKSVEKIFSFVYPTNFMSI